jgi:hypothetical protein
MPKYAGKATKTVTVAVYMSLQYQDQHVDALYQCLRGKTTQGLIIPEHMSLSYSQSIAIREDPQCF